jgi:hypothetical protein
MEISGLYPPAALPLLKDPLLPTSEEAVWVLEPA